MKWIKSRHDFRQPKIYSTTPSDKKEFHPSSWLIWLIFISIVLIIIAWFLFYSDYFTVKNIEVTGSFNSSVKSEIESLKGSNIIFLFLDNTEQDLANKYTSIKSIEVYKGIPDTLRVDVEVRKPRITWKVGEKIFYVDTEGIVFSLSGEDDLKDVEKNNLIHIIDIRSVPVKEGTQILTKDFVSFIIDLAEKFENYTGAKIQEIRVYESTFKVEIQTDRDFFVILNTTREIEPQLKGLKNIIKDHMGEIKEYIDMRVEGKAFYK